MPNDPVHANGDEVTFESECEILLRVGGDHDRAAQDAKDYA